MDKSTARVMYECQNLTLSAGTGIATYARNLSRAARSAGFHTSGLFGVNRYGLSRNAALNEVQLFDLTPIKKNFSLSGLAGDLWRFCGRDLLGVSPRVIERHGIVLDAGRSLFDGAFDQVRVVPRLMERARAHFYRYGTLMPIRDIPDVDILHTTHAVPMRAAKAATLCTVHDIIPLRLPHTTLDDKRYFYNLIKALIKKTDRIVTVSEHSKRDLISFFGVSEDRIVNTYQAVSMDPGILALSDDQIAEDVGTLFGLEYKEYYVFVGAIEPKKNVSGLIEAYSASGSKRPLVLAGALGWQYDGDVERIEDERFLSYSIDGSRIRKEKAVRRLSYIPRRNLFKLIRGARALIFPSIYEGFGLPVLEAMLLGTAVITSNASSLPEVAGDAALLVDPTDSESISKAIRLLDRDDALCAELAQRGPAQAAKFSPEIYQERLTRLYRSLL